MKSVLPTTLQHILEKAENLLNKDGVISETIVKPHYVCVAKNGKATWNDFPGWNACKICSHSLAVAERIGRISDHLK